jgi:hypothetical protein
MVILDGPKQHLFPPNVRFTPKVTNCCGTYETTRRALAVTLFLVGAGEQDGG